MEHVSDGCTGIRLELGAYALDALEPDERDRVAAHLTHCADCTAELSALDSVSSILRTDDARASAVAETPGSPEADAALARIAAERRRDVRSTRRLRVATAASSSVAAAAVVLALVLGTHPVDHFAPNGLATTLRPATGVAADARVRLSARPWGTQVDLATARLPALAAGAYYEVWLVRRDGTRVAAGTFRPTTASGKARVRLAAAIGLDEIARIGVTRESGGVSSRVLSASA